jgi:hypothetical protein
MPTEDFIVAVDTALYLAKLIREKTNLVNRRVEPRSVSDEPALRPKVNGSY